MRWTRSSDKFRCDYVFIAGTTTQKMARVNSSNSTEEKRKFTALSEVYFVLGILIILGNALTIAVFWKRRFKTMARGVYLLINLAFADALVGAAVLTKGAILQSQATNQSQRKSAFNILSGVLFFTTNASIVSLTVVALERTYAIVRPIKHRTTRTTSYFNAIRLVWAVATFSGTWDILYKFEYLGRFAKKLVLGFVSFAFPLIICISYTTLWWITSRRPQQRPQRCQQNKRLARTLFIVTFLSLITWIPGEVAWILLVNTNIKHSSYQEQLPFILQFTNSLLNPFVYALRMPEYRKEVKSLLCRKRPPKEKVIPTSGMRGVTLLSMENLLRSESAIHLQITGNSAEQMTNFFNGTVGPKL